MRWVWWWCELFVQALVGSHSQLFAADALLQEGDVQQPELSLSLALARCVRGLLGARGAVLRRVLHPLRGLLSHHPRRVCRRARRGAEPRGGRALLDLAARAVGRAGGAGRRQHSVLRGATLVDGVDGRDPERERERERGRQHELLPGPAERAERAARAHLSERGRVQRVSLPPREDPRGSVCGVCGIRRRALSGTVRWRLPDPSMISAPPRASFALPPLPPSSFLLPPNRLVPRGTRCVGRVGGWDPRDFLHAGVRPERSGQCRVDGQAIRSVHDGHVGIRWVLVVDGEPTSSLTGSLWVWVWVWV